MKEGPQCTAKERVSNLNITHFSDLNRGCDLGKISIESTTYKKYNKLK